MEKTNDTQVDGTNVSKEDGTSDRFNKEPFTDESSLGSLTFTYDFNWATLTSITSYWDREYHGVFDNSALVPFINFVNSLLLPPGTPPVTNALVNQPATTTRFTQEFRLSSVVGDRSLNWTAGVF